MRVDQPIHMSTHKELVLTIDGKEVIIAGRLGDIFSLLLKMEKEINREHKLRITISCEGKTITPEITKWW